MKKTKLFIYFIIFILAITGSGFIPVSNELDPSKWVKVVVIDTTNVPLAVYDDFVKKISLENTAGDRKYDNLPRIEKTKNVFGDFSAVGHSRIIYFSSGDTLVETIIAKKVPYIFGYEITKASLPMKRVAHKARGLFERSEVDGDKTITKWTYSFHHKNFISRYFINRYINNTHRQWMKDMLKATRVQVEKAYNESLAPASVSD